MSLDICPDCNLSICDSDGGCGCSEGRFRVTFEYTSGTMRRHFFDTVNKAESAMDKFDDSNDNRRAGCILEVREKDGRWYPCCGEI